MHKFLCAVSLSLTLLAGHASADEQQEPSDAALSFVGQFSDDHLSGMLSRLGGRSKVFIGLAQAHGEIVGKVLDLAVEDAVRRHGPKWQQNMATAWMPLLNDSEFDSLRTEGAQSPHTEKYLELRSVAGKSMQASSQEFFQTILSEVIAQTQDALSNTKE